MWIDVGRLPISCALRLPHREIGQLEKYSKTVGLRSRLLEGKVSLGIAEAPTRKRWLPRICRDIPVSLERISQAYDETFSNSMISGVGDVRFCIQSRKDKNGLCVYKSVRLPSSLCNINSLNTFPKEVPTFQRASSYYQPYIYSWCLHHTCIFRSPRAFCCW